MGNFSQSKNKFGCIYVPPLGLATKAGLTSRFLQRKLAEYQALQAEIAALRAKAGTPEAPTHIPEEGQAPLSIT